MNLFEYVKNNYMYKTYWQSDILNYDPDTFSEPLNYSRDNYNLCFKIGDIEYEVVTFSARHRDVFIDFKIPCLNYRRIEHIFTIEQIKELFTKTSLEAYDDFRQE